MIPLDKFCDLKINFDRLETSITRHVHGFNNAFCEFRSLNDRYVEKSLETDRPHVVYYIIYML